MDMSLLSSSILSTSRLWWTRHKIVLRHLWLAGTIVLLFGVPVCAQGVITPERKVRLTDLAQQEKSQAQKARLSRLLNDAQVLYRNGAYETAIKRFQEAYALSDDNNILFNIAISYQQLRDWDRCMGFIDQYLETAAQSPRRDRAINAKQSCSARRRSNQTLYIDSRPSGAAIYLANRKTPIQGYTPFKKSLAVGVQRVWIELQGYEPEIRDIEIQRDEPFRLSVVLTKRIDPGWLFVDSTIKDAQVYLDGRALQLTPFPAPLSVSSGRHQLQVKRDGFTQINQQIEIKPFLMTRIDAPLERTNTLTSWRSATGWVAVSLGVLSFVGALVAGHYADRLYNDTDEFDRLSGFERLGHGLGGGLMGLGLGLITWDYARDDILPSDRNPSYGQSVETPDPPGFRARHGQKTSGDPP